MSTPPKTCDAGIKEKAIGKIAFQNPSYMDRYFAAYGKVTIFFCFPDTRVWGKHSAWTSTAKWRRPPRTVPALTLGQNRAEARTHFSMKGEIYWADYNQKQYLFT